MKFLPLGLALTLVAMPAMAHDYTIGDLVIEHPYSFATPPGAQAGAGYMTITNTGDTAQTLTGVAADFPAVQIHRSEETDGVMRMTEQASVEIAPGEAVSFAPGGFHVMFMGLGADALEDGESFDATLTFGDLGDVVVTFNVEARDGAADHGAMDGMDHGADGTGADQ